MPLTPDQTTEIEVVRAQRSSTRRATVPALEDMLGQPLPVLDHGFIRVVDYMGDDAAIVQAARVSYGAGTKKTSDDRGLVRYLMRHRHSTPFEMCEIKFHVKLPIFVARQWVRHRTANINEYSARYSILDKEFYVPDASYLKSKREEAAREKREKKGQTDMFGSLSRAAAVQDLAAQSTKNKQGREDLISETEADEVLKLIRSESSRAYTNYGKLLNEDAGEIIDPEKLGLARELARIVLPTNYYTQWYWKIDLHNLFHFLSLRMDSHAQYEIRVYADKIGEIVSKWVPLAWGAFEEYRKGGANLSSAALLIVKRLVAGEKVTQEASGMSKREWGELMDVLGREA